MAIPAPLPTQDELLNVGPLFPVAMPVPGIQHILDNLNREVHQDLGYWQTFYPLLKNIASILSTRHRKKHLVASCMHNTCWASHADMVTSFSLDFA